MQYNYGPNRYCEALQAWPEEEPAPTLEPLVEVAGLPSATEDADDRREWSWVRIGTYVLAQDQMQGPEARNNVPDFV